MFQPIPDIYWILTVEQVQQGLSELYPDGTDEVAQGVVIRELFRHIKQKMGTS